MWKPSKRGSGGSPELWLGPKGQKLFAFWIVRDTSSRHGVGAKMTPKRSLGSCKIDRPASPPREDAESPRSSLVPCCSTRDRAGDRMNMPAFVLARAGQARCGSDPSFCL